MSSANRMDPDWKERWVTALRSGKYEQGKGCLRSGDKFCCFGVLTDLVIRDEAACPDLEWRPWSADPWERSTMTPDGKNAAYPPDDVVRETGIPGNNTQVLTSDGMVSLGVLNDAGANFKTIADLIEQRL